MAFGALTLYADRPHAFDEQTRSHFTELANDLAYGVMAIRTRADRARVEAELRRIEAYLEEGQRLTHTGSWAWNIASRENVYWSPEHYRIFGLDPAKDAQSFEKALERIVPEDRAKFRSDSRRRDPGKEGFRGRLANSVCRTGACDMLIASGIPSSTRTAWSSSM